MTVLLAFTLTFTLPALESDGTGCGPNPWGIPEDHIAYVACYDAATGEELSRLPTYWDYRPGDAVTWVVDVAGQRQVYVRAFDEMDNGSCPSNVREVDGGPPPVTGVPPKIAQRLEYFDLAGRKVRQPARPGVYFVRVTDAAGVHRNRIVVVK